MSNMHYVPFDFKRLASFDFVDVSRLNKTNKCVVSLFVTMIIYFKLFAFYALKFQGMLMFFYIALECFCSPDSS